MRGSGVARTVISPSAVETFPLSLRSVNRPEKHAPSDEWSLGESALASVSARVGAEGKQVDPLSVLLTTPLVHLFIGRVRQALACATS